MRLGSSLKLHALWAVCAVFLSGLMPGPVAPASAAPSEATARSTPAQEDCDSGSTSPARAQNRSDSIRALVSHLGLGSGAVIADIGAGSGNDTWLFAEIVGETGEVFSEEIAEDKVMSLRETAEQKSLPQVSAVLGCSADPCLPAGSIDLVYMNRVYHHFAKPRQMLRGIWRSLKPGGYLVIIDQRRGTLRDWVEQEVREKRHYLTAETTVVREAREEGFAFFASAEQLWHDDKPFVLVFRRPEGPVEPGGDPEPFEPIPVEKWERLFQPVVGRYRNPVFIALGQAREFIAPILDVSDGNGLDVVLEEWATLKNERPAPGPGLSVPSVLTEQGDPGLAEGSVDAVFFLDSYHLLFHAEMLLSKLHERLAPAGRIYILDRRASERLSRREASHRRRINPQTVRLEMEEAGFSLWFRGPRLAPDRFLMVFAKAATAEAGSR